MHVKPRTISSLLNYDVYTVWLVACQRVEKLRTLTKSKAFCIWHLRIDLCIEWNVWILIVTYHKLYWRNVVQAVECRTTVRLVNTIAVVSLPFYLLTHSVPTTKRSVISSIWTLHTCVFLTHYQETDTNTSWEINLWKWVGPLFLRSEILGTVNNLSTRARAL